MGVAEDLRRRIERLQWYIYILQKGLECVSCEAERVAKQNGSYSVRLNISVELRGKAWPMAAFHSDYRTAILTLIEYKLDQLWEQDRWHTKKGKTSPRKISTVTPRK